MSDTTPGLPANLTFPEELEEDFEVVRLLGAGGMGAVFEARDRALERTVAVKLLLEEGGPELHERFRREAAALAKLDHPNVVRVHSFGVTAAGPYLVMEYLEGEPLDRAAVADPLAAMLDVASGLEAVHAAGFVHRDVKPSNVVVTDGGRAVLVDFGLVYDPERTQVTSEGSIPGSGAYISPERLRGEAAGIHDDWYSWGVGLYQLVEGQMPYEITEVIRMAGGAPPRCPDFRKVDPKSPEARLVAAMLLTGPGERPNTRAALEEILAGGAPVELLPRPTRGAAPPRGPSRPERGTPRREVPDAAYLGGGILLGILLVAAGTWGWSTPAARPGPPPSMAAAPSAPPIAPPAAPPVAPPAAPPAPPPAPPAPRSPFVAPPAGPPPSRPTPNRAALGALFGKLMKSFTSPEILFGAAAGLAVTADPDAGILRVHTREGPAREIHIPPGTELLALAVSPDGGRVAAGGVRPGTPRRFGLRLWGPDASDAPTHDLVLESPPGHLHFVDGGRRLVSGELTAGVKVRDGATGELLRTLVRSSRPLALAASARGDVVAAVLFQGELVTWSGPDHAARAEVPAAAGDEAFELVALRADGRALAVARKGGRLALVDPATPAAETWSRPLHTEPRGLAFSADGSRLAVTGADGNVHVLDTATGRPLRTEWLEGARLGPCAFTPDDSEIWIPGPAGALRAVAGSR